MKVEYTIYALGSPSIHLYDGAIIFEGSEIDLDVQEKYSKVVKAFEEIGIPTRETERTCGDVESIHFELDYGWLLHICTSREDEWPFWSEYIVDVAPKEEVILWIEDSKVYMLQPTYLEEVESSVIWV